MDADVFGNRIAAWRLDANLSQEDLDQECRFPAGTVARLEQGKLAMTDDKLVRILICTGRDLLWAVAGLCGSLLKRLQSLEASLRLELGRERPPQPLDQDDDFQTALAVMFTNLEIILKKQTRATDRRALMMDILTEAAARDPHGESPKRKRATGSRRKKPPQPA
jgi:transcriptional regulator with XRE-family HTH domain